MFFWILQKNPKIQKWHGGLLRRLGQGTPNMSFLETSGRPRHLEPSGRRRAVICTGVMDWGADCINEPMNQCINESMN